MNARADNQTLFRLSLKLQGSLELNRNHIHDHPQVEDSIRGQSEEYDSYEPSDSSSGEDILIPEQCKDDISDLYVTTRREDVEAILQYRFFPELVFNLRSREDKLT
jgi:hypothetical protein